MRGRLGSDAEAASSSVDVWSNRCRLRLKSARVRPAALAPVAAADRRTEHSLLLEKLDEELRAVQV